MPLLHFLARERGEPADLKAIDAFTRLARQHDPAVAGQMGAYKSTANQLIDKMQTLDNARRSAVVRAAHDAIMPKMRLAAKTGKPEHVRAALGAMRTHGVRLAQQLGVTVPPTLAPPAAAPAATSMSPGGPNGAL